MKVANVLLLALAVIGLPTLGNAKEPPKKQHEKIQLQLKGHSQDAEFVARLVRRIGSVKTRSGSTFIIELKDGVDADRAAKILESKPQVEKVVVQEIEDEDKDKKDALGVETGDEDERYGRREAMKWWYTQRAYPNSTIDRDAYIAAAKHRDIAMSPARYPDASAKGSRSAPTTVNQWQFLGPRNMGTTQGVLTAPWSGRVNGICYVPGNSNAFYIASASGGVWKTTDGGVNWTPLSDTWPFLFSTCVKVHPTSTNIVYAGTGDFDSDYSGNGVTFGSGVMKSTDGGATWTALGIPQGFANYSISDIIIDPETPNIVTIAEGRGRADSSFNGAGFIWRTTDGGGTWTKVLNVNKSWSKMACSAISGGVRYYWAITQDGVTYRSADRGATWVPITTPITGGTAYIDRITTSPTVQQVAYILDSNNKKVYKTINAGTSWTDVTNGLPAATSFDNFNQSWYDAYIDVSNIAGQDSIFVGLIDVCLSANGGASWASVGHAYAPGTQIHPDQHCIAFDPADPSSGLLGSDGGIWHFHYDTGTAALTCTSLNTNLGLTEHYHLDIHPTSPNTVLAGSQDTSTQYSRNGVISDWDILIGGDGGYCGINPSNPQVQYGSVPFGLIAQTTDDWVNTISTIQAQNQTGTSFIAPFVLDPNNGSILYSGQSFGLNKYNASTNTWTNHLGGVNLTNNYLQAVAVAPSNSSTIYTGAVDGQVWMTTNGGSTWTQITTGTPGLPNRAVTSIAVDQTNASDILVGLSGTGTPHLYRCTNPGAGASRVWTNVSGSGSSIPDIPLNAVARDPDVAGSWFVGTDAGVFSSQDSGATWQNATNPLGLPNVQVNFLKIRRSDRRMYAATWGRGVWVMQLPFPSIVKGVSVSPTSVPSGNTSTGTVTLWQAAPVGGTTVNLSSNNAAAVVPATVTVLQGATTATFNITTSNATYSSINATVTQSLTSDPNHTTVLKVMPNNRASFVSQSVPTTMIAGQSYPASLVFKNTGGTTWDAAHTYQLYSANPYNNSTWGMNRIPMTSSTVAPSANGNFGATVIAPASTGTYNFQWQPYEGSDASLFGATSSNVVVNVTKVANAARYISRTGATTVNAGADFYIQNTMKNVGTATWTQAAGFTMMTINPNNDAKWTNTRAYMPTGSSIAFNSNVTFTSLCTAPLTPGLYSMQWQCNKSGVVFGDTSPLLNINVIAGADNAQYVSNTAVPTSVGPSTGFSATYTMKNIGSGTWDATYSLVPVGSNNFGVTGIASGSVVPNANGTFTSSFTAPATPGTYTFSWRMAHGATKFGQPSPVISIVVSADAAQYVSRTGLTTVNAGADFYIQNTMKNTGTTSWSTATGYSMMTVNPNNDAKWTATRAYLASGTIAPGSPGTFTALCTAPITPGSYTMQWQMNKSGTPFGEKSPLLNITVVNGADNAQFVSYTNVPSTIAHSATFNATITMKNIGTGTWGAGYTLVPIGSNNFNVTSIAAVSTAPGSNDAFNATFTAPVAPGSYTFQLRMQHTTTKFGQPSTKVTIIVT